MLWRTGGASVSCSAVRLLFDDEQRATSSELPTAVTAISASLSPGRPNLNRATDRSAPETGALREAIHLEPCLQRTFGGSMAYEGIAEPRTFRPTSRFRLRAGLLGKAVTAFWASHGSVKGRGRVRSKDRGRRQCIAIQTIQNRWQVTSGRY
jgi:hypothetical protein